MQADSPIDAETVADEIVTIETCQAVVPQLCPEVARDRARNPLDRWPTWTVTARLYRFRDVVLDRTHMVLLHRGRVIAQTNYLQSDAALAALSVRADDLVGLPAGPVYAPCFDHWDGNYYHWTAHSIPALHAILQRHPEGGVCLVLPKLQPWQAESLRLIGADRLGAVTAEAGRQYFLPDVAYLDIVAGSLDFAVSPLSAAAYARVCAAVADGPAPGARIYIDRGGSRSRSVPNEAALADMLRARGFLVVRLETMTLSDQVALFRAASVVVGLHGAGLANIAYCRPGTLVYEIMPAHNLNPCYMVLALQAGLRYWTDMFETGAAPGHTSPWTRDVDIDAVARRLSDLACG
jgi:capsular polysaccharide biosynthesis protein